MIPSAEHVLHRRFAKEEQSPFHMERCWVPGQLLLELAAGKFTKDVCVEVALLHASLPAKCMT